MNEEEIFEEGLDITMNLLEKVEKLESENTELKEALNWFCNRVDAGEVRSKRTYERFKELLDKYE